MWHLKQEDPIIIRLIRTFNLSEDKRVTYSKMIEGKREFYRIQVTEGQTSDFKTKEAADNAYYEICDRLCGINTKVVQQKLF